MIYGSLYESDSISPKDEKEKRYTECEYCDGDGYVDINMDDMWETLTCPKCHGEGQIEIED